MPDKKNVYRPDYKPKMNKNQKYRGLPPAQPQSAAQTPYGAGYSSPELSDDPGTAGNAGNAGNSGNSGNSGNAGNAGNSSNSGNPDNVDNLSNSGTYSGAGTAGSSSGPETSSNFKHAFNINNIGSSSHNNLFNRPVREENRPIAHPPVLTAEEHRRNYEAYRAARNIGNMFDDLPRLPPFPNPAARRREYSPPAFASQLSTFSPLTQLQQPVPRSGIPARAQVLGNPNAINSQPPWVADPRARTHIPQDSSAATLGQFFGSPHGMSYDQQFQRPYHWAPNQNQPQSSYNSGAVNPLPFPLPLMHRAREVVARRYIAEFRSLSAQGQALIQKLAYQDIEKDKDWFESMVMGGASEGDLMRYADYKINEACSLRYM